MNYSKGLAIALALASVVISLASIMTIFLAISLISFHKLNHMSFLSPLLPVLPVLMVVLGVASILVSFYGIVVAGSASKTHYFVYSGLLAILFLGHSINLFFANELEHMSNDNLVAEVIKYHL